MTTFKRLMGLDYGEERIGVAVSDLLGMTAQAVGFIKNDEKKWQEFKKYFEQYQIQTCVIGLPLRLDGADTVQTQKVRQFKEEIETKFPVSFILHDERWTTKTAQQVLIQGGLSREKRKQKIDALAAQVMLQSYLVIQSNKLARKTI